MLCLDGNGADRALAEVERHGAEASHRYKLYDCDEDSVEKVALGNTYQRQ